MSIQNFGTAMCSGNSAQTLCRSALRPFLLRGMRGHGIFKFRAQFAWDGVALGMCFPNACAGRGGQAMSRAGVAQLVEHLICNQRVGGSNPFASSSKPDCRANSGGSRGKATH